MSNDSSVPTAEDKLKYDEARKELLMALAKKRQVDKQLAQLEVQIYNLEGVYLTETAAHSGGNIIQGFEGYLKNPPGGRRRYEVSDADRMFSNSSATYKKSLEIAGEGEESTATADDHHNHHQSRNSTPLTVPIPPALTKELTAAQQKKNRDREYQRKKRANAARQRSAGIMSDEESVTSASSRRPTKRARVQDDD